MQIKNFNTLDGTIFPILIGGSECFVQLKTNNMVHVTDTIPQTNKRVRTYMMQMFMRFSDNTNDKIMDVHIKLPYNDGVRITIKEAFSLYQPRTIEEFHTVVPLDIIRTKDGFVNILQHIIRNNTK